VQFKKAAFGLLFFAGGGVVLSVLSDYALCANPTYDAV